MTGVVILYYPDKATLISNINTYIHGLDKLYLYDNSEDVDSKLGIDLSSISEKIVYENFGENAGISKRLNQAIAAAQNDGADYLLTMDQDSSFKSGDFERYQHLIYSNLTKDVAQFGVNCQPEFTKPNESSEIAISLITSGSVISLEYINNIGLFDENLFIDFVDAEFSYRVSNSGFHNLLFPNIILNHIIGSRVEGRSLITFKKSMRIVHSPIRVYYILRNGLHLYFKHKGLTKNQLNDVRRSIMVIKNDFIYNPELVAVYKNSFFAIKDFILNKIGKN